MLGVVVVNYGSHQLVERALRDLDWGALDARPIVVDSLHSAAERSAITHLAASHGWDLLALDGNPGFGAAVNKGFAHARDVGCSVLLTLNPDASISADVLRQLHVQARNEPNALIAPKIMTSVGAVEYNGAYVDLANGTMHGNHGELTPAVSGELRLDEIEKSRHWSGWLAGSCIVAHRDVLDRVGGFDESLFLYWEDVDFSYRCRRAGASLVVRTDLVVTHDEGGTQQRDAAGRAKSQLYYYYNCRNRLVFASLHLQTRDLLRWIIATPRASWAILMRGGRRQLVHSRAPLWGALRGSGSGLAVAVRRVIADAFDFVRRSIRG